MSRVDLRPTPSVTRVDASTLPDPTVPSRRFISKSKFLSGLQCHKLIWHAYNAKHLIPEPDPHQQAVFDQGHRVGQLARQLFPGGIEVGQGIDDFDELLALFAAVSRRKRLRF